MLISFIQVAVTPHIACCHTALTGDNEVNSDLSAPRDLSYKLLLLQSNFSFAIV